MTLRPRDRIALIMVLFLGLAGAYYVLALTPERHKATTLESSIATQRQALALAQQQFAAGRGAQASLRASAGEWASIRLAVPAKSDIPALLRILERSAIAEHVKMQSIQLAPSSGATPGATASATAATAAARTQGAQGATQVPISLTFGGDYMALDRLVRRFDSFVVVSGGKVQATGPLVSVGSVQLSGTSKLVAQLTATIYQLPASSAPSATTTTTGSR